VTQGLINRFSNKHSLDKAAAADLCDGIDQHDLSKKPSCDELKTEFKVTRGTSPLSTASNRFNEFTQAVYEQNQN
jgi:hypothetical protein